MVFPLPLLGAASVLGGHAARLGITSAGVRGFGGQFVQSLPFGAGYSLGTYLGFPKNYQQRQSSYSRLSNYTLDMPYGYGYGNRYGRYYTRFGRRYRRRFPRRYRRFY